MQQGQGDSPASRDELITLDRDRAAEMAGLSRRQVAYWHNTGVASPSIVRSMSERKTVRLYNFAELVSLLVAAELKSRGASLPHIRTIVARLHDRGYRSPLSQLVFATQGNEIYFQDEDGRWEGGRRDGQFVLREVLDLEPIRARIRAATERRPERVGQVERRRSTLGHKPVVAGTRIPVATVLEYLEDGATPEQIVENFPGLRPEDVEAVRASTSVA